MGNIRWPAIVSQLFLALLVLLAVPVPSQAANPRFDRALFLQIADEMFAGMDRAYDRIHPGGCAGARLGKADAVEFRVAGSRMIRFFPRETLRLDPSAEALAEAIREAESKIELYCANRTAGSPEDALEALKAHGDLYLKALRLFQAYSRGRD